MRKFEIFSSPQTPHHDSLLRICRMTPFLRPQSSQNRQNIPQSKIIMHLLGKLLFTKLIQRVELPGQDYVVFEPARREFHTNYDLSVRYHHRHRTEHDLQVFGQFLSTRIAGIHRQEYAEFDVHGNVVAVHEYEGRFAFLSRLQDNVNLLGGDR